VESPRRVRIFRMTTGASMVATPRMRPPQRGQANTSTANVWRNSSGHGPPHRRQRIVHGQGGDGRLTSRRTGRPGRACTASMVATGSRCGGPVASCLSPDPSSPGGTVGACDVAHATDGSSAGKADGSRP
jgi:hypothetical protein